VGHFKYLYLCGGTPKIIKILVVFIPGKALSGEVGYLNQPSLVTHINGNLYI
jgi:hypothetical protein